MKKHSLCFIVLMLLLSAFLGTVLGSLLGTVFGLEFLNYEFLPEGGIHIRNFYMIKNLQIQMTPATLLGIAVAIYIMYKTS